MTQNKYFTDRKHDVLVSYSFEDQDIVGELINWLGGTCGLNVWCDKNVKVEAFDKSDIKEVMSGSRRFIRILSRFTSKASQLEDLYRIALAEAKIHKDFRIVSIICDDLEEKDLPSFVRETSCIKISRNGLGIDTAVAILQDWYPIPLASSIQLNQTKSLYVSRSWRNQSEEKEPADFVCEIASQLGFQLLGDYEDQSCFDAEERIASIINSCAGFIVILPYRNTPHGTSKWMLKELSLAIEAKLPGIICKDHRVLLPKELISVENAVSIIDLDLENRINQESVAKLTDALLDLNRKHNQSEKLNFVCYLGDTILPSGLPIEIVNDLTFRIMGMVCLNPINTFPNIAKTIDDIQKAYIVIADMSGNEVDLQLLTGVAIGLTKNLHILIKMDHHEKSMILDRFGSLRYENNLERLGYLYRILCIYRRRVINREL